MSRIDRLRPIAPPTPIADDAVTAAEAAFRTRFPSGYRTLMTRYGRGVLGGMIRIYTPDALLSGPLSVDEWRRRIDEYWFWDASAALLTKQRALECVIIGDTVGGDEIAFHPDDAERVYVFAHDFDEIFLASNSGLTSALDWFFTSGVLDQPLENDEFQPY